MPKLLEVHIKEDAVALSKTVWSGISGVENDGCSVLRF